MDLYLLPFAGSFVTHIACREAGIPLTLHRVDRKTKRLDDGRDYLAINPKGTVPALRTPDGAVLTESIAVLLHITELAPALAPRGDRYELVEWLAFVTTEVHMKHLWTIFSHKTTPEMKAFARASLPSVLELVSQRLGDRAFVVGDTFTVADAYLFWTLFVAPHGGVPIDAWPNLAAYAARIRERPSVQAAFAAEGPLYAREQSAA